MINQSLPFQCKKHTIKCIVFTKTVNLELLEYGIMQSHTFHLAPFIKAGMNFSEVRVEDQMQIGLNGVGV